MRLVVRCDAHNTRTVRESWERHGRPAGLRRLLEAEAAAGVQQPALLEEAARRRLRDTSRTCEWRAL